MVTVVETTNVATGQPFLPFLRRANGCAGENGAASVRRKNGAGRDFGPLAVLVAIPFYGCGRSFGAGFLFWDRTPELPVEDTVESGSLFFCRDRRLQNGHLA